MQLAAWLDVALEGGVTELERALCDYRALRRLLSGNWRMKARRVEDLAGDVRERWLDVDRALDRARRRARVDDAASAGLELARRVETERSALEAALSGACPPRAPVLVQLDRLCEAAEEEAHYERSMERFRAERVAWTVGMLGLMPAIPFSAWWTASAGGTIGTIFSADGLAEPQCLFLLLALFSLISLSTLRLSSWSWLGVPRPVLLSPLLGSGLLAMTSAALLIAFSVRSVTPFLVTLGVILAFALPATLLTWWRHRDTRASDMDAVTPPSSER